MPERIRELAGSGPLGRGRLGRFAGDVVVDFLAHFALHGFVLCDPSGFVGGELRVSLHGRPPVTYAAKPAPEVIESSAGENDGEKPYQTASRTRRDLAEGERFEPRYASGYSGFEHG